MKLSEYKPLKICDNCGYGASITPADGHCFVCGKGKFIRAYAVPAPVAAAHDAVVETIDEALERMEPIAKQLPDGLYNLLSFARAALDKARGVE